MHTCLKLLQIKKKKAKGARAHTLLWPSGKHTTGEAQAKLGVQKKSRIKELANCFSAGAPAFAFSKIKYLI